MYDPINIMIPKGQYLSRDFYIGAKYGAIVNASIGTSTEDRFDVELEKAQTAIGAGATIITDHSICGNVNQYHQKLRKAVSVPMGAVPVYELALRNPQFTDDQAIEIVEEFLQRGFNILTLHCTVLKEDVNEQICKNRVIPITSKGGKIILERMKLTGIENPFYTCFDKLLSLFKKYNAVISLGPTYRQASVADNCMDENDAYWMEIKRMSELVSKAIKAEVPIIVEGIGHARIDLIPEYVKRSKEICYQVPYRVLTVSTDIALGYDNISSAISSSIAVLNGANIVTAVTASEHAGLPSVQDVENGVVAARVAIHSAELCILKDSINKDKMMSIHRQMKKNCQGSMEYSIYPKGAEKALRDRFSAEGCSMCGELCALKRR